ncbi:MAG: ABC transporter ATP-binding protein/permease [Lachnospiraceae bacterium]|nr:ABC transporter ATP-binding protein/permease [Lachnospiraceae bacterium]
MLELRNIKKDYPAGDGTVHALKGINLKFRRSEFVSILGPSGCGKTTMLNLIGGLDQYTSGDLLINGISTKNYRDRDWDSYRNHSIGFVFQSYNLIPHQTVLQNVELALTLSGVSRQERRQRAIQALKDVGLETQINKKPGAMSGGQMQRVAIARALVNNPDIILADEPTGALDTETSVQVMEILKEISRDRLIIMVTHNPDLAQRYSSRIIRMLDGDIISDSAPLTDKELQLEAVNDKAAQEKKKKAKMPSMSMATSFSLSLKNLFTKKGRTLLTSFAGSIGIIGIALILSISQGLTAYIDAVQEETLSSYPLTIQKTQTDLSSLMSAFMGIRSENVDHDGEAVYTKSSLYDLLNAMNNLETTENDLKSFKAYLEKESSDPESALYEAVNGLKYTYDLDLQIYTKNVDGQIIRSDLQELLTDLATEYMSIDMSSLISMRDQGISSITGGSSSMMTGGMSLWEEMLSGDNGELINDVLKNQYDLVYGSWPNSYDEIVLVLDQNNELDDMTLYALGLESKETVDRIAAAALEQEELVYEDKSWSYEEICGMEFRTILNADCYSYDEHTGLYMDLRETDAGLQYLYDNAIPLKVTGIIRPNEDVEAPMLSGTICYTSELTTHVVENMKESPAILAQLEDPSTDIFTGLPFNETTGNLSDAQKAEELKAYIEELDTAKMAEVYVQIKSVPTQEQLQAAVSQAMEGFDREAMEEMMIQAFTAQMGMSEAEIAGYIASMGDEEITSYFTQMMTEQVKAQYAAQVQQQTASMKQEELAAGLTFELESYTDEQCALYYDEIMIFSENTWEGNLTELGYLDLDDPASISIYASTFDNKEVIEDAIAAYNEGQDELSQITYVDYVGLMMSSVSTIINAITYILIAFVAISLVVSSIMIGVITLISVQERTKEIGILRAIGASKKNVSSLFSAETIIIGFTSGLLGVLVTYLLCIPINMIIHSLTGITGMNVFLPVNAAVILVLISMFLTLISGIIPSRSAARKDPVVALRSE